MQELRQRCVVLARANSATMGIEQQPGREGPDDAGEANELGNECEGEAGGEPEDEHHLGMPRAGGESNEPRREKVPQAGGATEEDRGPQEDSENGECGDATALHVGLPR